MRSVLILDGYARQSLAAARSLGQKGFQITSANARGLSLASCSRYTKTRLTFPDPEKPGNHPCD